MIILRADNIRKMHSKTEGISNASLSVSTRETVGIRGPSGSGKSTLLCALSLIDPPDSGSLLLFGEEYNFTKPQAFRVVRDGIRLNNLKPARQIWPRLTVVFQEHFLWPNLSLARNITLSLQEKPELRTEAMRLIEAFQLQSIASKYPHECSLGQRQRAALIRALALLPEILLMDEPTAALDRDMIDILISELNRRSQRGLANLIISHDLNFLNSVCHRTYWLAAGQLYDKCPLSAFAYQCR